MRNLVSPCPLLRDRDSPVNIPWSRAVWAKNTFPGTWAPLPGRNLDLVSIPASSKDEVHLMTNLQSMAIFVSYSHWKDKKRLTWGEGALSHKEVMRGFHRMQVVQDKNVSTHIEEKNKWLQRYHIQGAEMTLTFRVKIKHRLRLDNIHTTENKTKTQTQNKTKNK